MSLPVIEYALVMLAQIGFPFLFTFNFGLDSSRIAKKTTIGSLIKNSLCLFSI